MNRTLTVFRTMIILSLVLGLMGALIDFAGTGLLPADLSKAYEDYQPFPESQWIVFGILALLVFVAGLVGAIGLLMLARWARALSFWLTLATTVGTVFLGATLYSGPAKALLDISMGLWGAALAMAYFSELKVHFGPVESPTAAVA